MNGTVLSMRGRAPGWGGAEGVQRFVARRGLQPSVTASHAKIRSAARRLAHLKSTSMHRVLEDTFARFDRDRNGTLSRLEFMRLLREGLNIRVGSHEIDSMLAEYDHTGSSTKRITIEAFMADCAGERPSTAASCITNRDAHPPPRAVHNFRKRMLTTAQKLGNGSSSVPFDGDEALHDSLGRIFMSLDEDSSGKIARHELRHALSDRGMLALRMSEEELDGVVAHFDANGDGSLETKELVDEIVEYGAHARRKNARDMAVLAAKQQGGAMVRSSRGARSKK